MSSFLLFFLYFTVANNKILEIQTATDAADSVCAKGREGFVISNLQKEFFSYKTKSVE